VNLACCKVSTGELRLTAWNCYRTLLVFTGIFTFLVSCHTRTPRRDIPRAWAHPGPLVGDVKGTKFLC
jgi:hypothetical protein